MIRKVKAFRERFLPKSKSEWQKFGFLLFGSLSLAVAVIVLLVWAKINWNYSYNSLKQLNSGSLPLKNGQTLQIEYPAFIFANNRQFEIKFILRGSANTVPAQPVVLTVGIPSSLSAVKPETQKYSETIALELWPDGNGQPVMESIGLINANFIKGCFSKKPEILIKSPELNEDKPIKTGVEATKPASLRNFMDISVNKNSPAILVATGLLSAGSFLLARQLQKQLERDAVLEDREHHKNQKELDEFKELLKKDPVAGVTRLENRWRQLDLPSFEKLQKPGDSSEKSHGDQQEMVVSADKKVKNNQPGPEGLIKKQNTDLLDELQTQMLLSPWQEPIGKAIITALLEGKYLLAQQIAENMQILHSLADKKRMIGEPKSHLFVTLCNYVISASKKDNWQKDIDASEIMQIYAELGEPIIRLIIQLVEKMVTTPEGVIKINETFNNENNEKGRALLFNCDIRHSLLSYLSISSPGKDAKNAATEILNTIRERIQWQPLWPVVEIETSSKLVQWLASRIAENPPKQNPFGPEFSELDPRLARYHAYPHPLYKSLSSGKPALVLGESGSGKTALALRLTSDFQSTAEYSIPRVFPIYYALKDEHISLHWIISTISSALADFVANNPRNYLFADVLARYAMGRLIVKYYGSIDELKFRMQLSRNYSAFICQRIMDEITPLSAGTNPDIDPEESLKLLYQARPEGFQRIDFLIDMHAIDEIDRQSKQLNELIELSLSLALRNIFLKVFAPKSLESTVKKSFPGSSTELIWTDDDIEGLLNTRMENKFSSLCKIRGLTQDPVALMVEAAHHSPRKLIKQGNLLMQYAEMNLREGQGLDRAAFQFAGILDDAGSN